MVCPTPKLSWYHSSKEDRWRLDIGKELEADRGSEVGCMLLGRLGAWQSSPSEKQRLRFLTGIVDGGKVNRKLTSASPEMSDIEVAGDGRPVG